MRDDRFPRYGAVLALVLGLALTGCRGTPAESEASETPAADFSDVDKSVDIEATVEVTVTGAVSFRFVGERQFMPITRVGAKGLEVNLVGSGFMDPVILPDDPKNRFRWAFDLLNQYADEPGTFTLNGGAVNAQGVQNTALLVWLRVKDGAKPAVFDMDEVEQYEEFREIRQPCTVEIGPGMLSGAFRCPELASESGKTVAVDIRWRDGKVLPPEETQE